MENSALLNIKVIAGSTREGRFSDKAAVWIVEEINTREGVAAEMLDLRDYDMPFFSDSVSPAMKQKPYTNDAVVRFTKKIDEGDAFVIVTPEYNHGTSGVLKNALDWLVSDELLPGKEVIVFVCSAGDGIQAMDSLIEILKTMSLKVIPERCFRVSAIRSKFVDNELVDLELRKSLEALVATLSYGGKIK